jgi:hypothetical protein
LVIVWNTWDLVFGLFYKCVIYNKPFTTYKTSILDYKNNKKDSGTIEDQILNILPTKVIITARVMITPDNLTKKLVNPRETYSPIISLSSENLIRK